MIILLRDFITFDLFHFIPFFRLWDISLLLHECSPFSLFFEKKTTMFTMPILIGKALKQFHML